MIKPGLCECINWARAYTKAELEQPPEHHDNCKHRLIRVYKVSPELADGVHWSIAETKAQLIEIINEWTELPDHDIGDAFNIDIIEMSRYEINQLPEM